MPKKTITPAKPAKSPKRLPRTRVLLHTIHADESISTEFLGYLAIPLNFERDWKSRLDSPLGKRLFNFHDDVYYKSLVIRLDEALRKVEEESRSALEKGLVAAIGHAMDSDNPDLVFKNLLAALEQASNLPAKLPEPPLALPQKPLALWEPSKARNPNLKANIFLHQVWGPYLRAGILYQHHIRSFDPKLLEALGNQYRGRRAELTVLLPPKSAETEEILRKAGIPPSRKARSAATAIRRAASNPEPG